MRHRAVITLEKVIYHRFPVGLDVVGQTMGVGEVRQVGSVMPDLASQSCGDLGQRGGVRVQI